MATLTKNDILAMRKKGYLTDSAIASQAGITRQAIHQLRKKYGLAKVKDRLKDRDREILAMYNSGCLADEIAKARDISISQVYRIISRSK